MVGISERAMQYRSRRKDDPSLIERLKVLARERLRWGWRRLLIMMRREGWVIGERAFRRIYRALALHVTRVRKRHVRYVRGKALEPVSRRNERWSLDFMHARTVHKRTYRLLNVVDDFTGEVLAIVPQFSFGSADVIQVLEDIAFARGFPTTLRFDNGSEFCSHRMLRWSADNAVRLHFTQPGKPTQNGKVESLNGRIEMNC
jgi:putative transposase